MKRELYNGTVTVSRDEGHCYHVSTTPAKPDGVTTILGLVPKYLLPWVAKVTSEHIETSLLDRIQNVEQIDENYVVELCAAAKKAHTIKRDTAGDIGSFVHDFAEEAIKTSSAPELPDPTAPEYAGCHAFLRWLVNTQIDFSTAQSERIIFSKRLFYAGTCDLLAQINGQWAVTDFKTGSGFYEDQPLQLAAYALALEEELGIEIPHGFIIHLDKITGAMTPYHVPIDDELKTDWEAVRIAWRAVKRNQDRHKQIKAKAKGRTKCRTSAITTAAAPL